MLHSYCFGLSSGRHEILIFETDSSMYMYLWQFHGWKLCCIVDMDVNWFNDIFDDKYDNVMNNVV
jgi:hypothetical protein